MDFALFLSGFPLYSPPKFHSCVLGDSWNYLALCFHWSYVLLPTSLQKEGDQTLEHCTRAQQMLVLMSVRTCYVSCVTSVLIMCCVRVRAACHLWRIFQAPESWAGGWSQREMLRQVHNSRHHKTAGNECFMYYFDYYMAFIFQEWSDVLEIVQTDRVIWSLSLGNIFKN